MTAPFRVGLVGFSDIARRRFVPALVSSGLAHPVCWGTHAPDEARAWLVGARALEAATPESILARDDIDLVYISTANHTHADWTCRALQAGKHVICEKPLATHHLEIDRILATARATNRLVFENVMFLHHPQHRRVLELLATGHIGTLRMVRAAFGFTLEKPGNYRHDPEQGGGACHDLLVYLASCARLFVPGELRDFAGHLWVVNGLDVAAQGIARGDHVLYHFSLGFRQQYECHYELIGSAGSMRLDRAFSTPPEISNQLVVKRGASEERIGLPAADHFVETLRRVADLIANPGERCAVYTEIAERHRLIYRMRDAMKVIR